MSDDSLNRDEVEELLRSMDSGESKKKPADEGDAGQEEKPAAAPAADVDAAAEAMLAATKKPATTRQRVIAYDFKRPERVGKEQMRALQSMHEGFARNFGASASALLRTIVESKLISVDQLTYSEFVYSLEIPTCFNLLRPAPLEGNWILDISPSILFPIIDRMLGGSASSDSALKRPLSDIELRLTSRITNTFLRELAEAWANTINIEFEVQRVESNPQLVQIVPPNEVVILVSFEITMGKARGMVNLCIPFNTIERIGSKLSNNSWVGYASSRANDNTRQQLSELLSESKVELISTVATSTIKAVDLLNLQVGDIVTTEKDIKLPIDIEVEGVGKFLGRPGAFKGKKAVEVVGTVEQSDKSTPPD
ncbi:MAG: flagellar motor switch protein FliM [Aureliella sp.]